MSGISKLPSVRSAQRAMLLLPVCVVLFCSANALALESETVSAFALRAQKQLSDTSSMEFQFSSRWQQDLQEQERSIVQVSLSKDINQWEVSGAYNQQFDRITTGKEHRVWQQLRYNFTLDSGAMESSARIEERYFTDTDKAGARLRMLNRWTYPLDASNSFRLGHEWVFNLSDIGTNTLRGVSQNRLITSISHKLSGGTRIEFEYQLRYLHLPAKDNQVQHQLQLSYIFGL